MPQTEHLFSPVKQVSNKVGKNVLQRTVPMCPQSSAALGLQRMFKHRNSLFVGEEWGPGQYFRGAPRGSLRNRKLFRRMSSEDRPRVGDGPDRGLLYPRAPRRQAAGCGDGQLGPKATHRPRWRPAPWADTAGSSGPSQTDILPVSTSWTHSLVWPVPKISKRKKSWNAVMKITGIPRCFFPLWLRTNRTTWLS